MADPARVTECARLAEGLERHDDRDDPIPSLRHSGLQLGATADRRAGTLQ